MRKIDVCDMEEVGSIESSEKTIAILGDRCGHRRRNRTGIRQAHSFYAIYGRSVMSAQTNVGGVSVRSRNGAPSRKGCVVRGQND